MEGEKCFWNFGHGIWMVCEACFVQKPALRSRALCTGIVVDGRWLGGLVQRGYGCIRSWLSTLYQSERRHNEEIERQLYRLIDDTTSGKHACLDSSS